LLGRSYLQVWCCAVAVLVDGRARARRGPPLGGLCAVSDPYPSQLRPSDMSLTVREASEGFLRGRGHAAGLRNGTCRVTLCVCYSNCSTYSTPGIFALITSSKHAFKWTRENLHDHQDTCSPNTSHPRTLTLTVTLALALGLTHGNELWALHYVLAKAREHTNRKHALIPRYEHAKHAPPPPQTHARPGALAALGRERESRPDPRGGESAA
jgi:hypothetical protein